MAIRARRENSLFMVSVGGVFDKGNALTYEKDGLRGKRFNN
jgi:hypothetical protein